MIKAIVSDIHSNIEAFEAVMEDIDKKQIPEVTCLGDVIGYGPNPRECITLAMGFGICMRGNHEEALLFFASEFNKRASDAIDWTRKQLNLPEFPKEMNRLLWNYLDGMLEKREVNDITYVHASPRMPTREYVRPVDIQNKKKLSSIFEQIQHVCFCGHTHEAGIITNDFKYYHPSSIKNEIKLEKDKKYIINVGSVGQPRDGDNRASYVTFDGSVVKFHRVAYDFKKTMKKIINIPELSNRLALRLREGK